MLLTDYQSVKYKSIQKYKPGVQRDRFSLKAQLIYDTIITISSSSPLSSPISYANEVNYPSLYPTSISFLDDTFTNFLPFHLSSFNMLKNHLNLLSPFSFTHILVNIYKFFFINTVISQCFETPTCGSRVIFVCRSFEHCVPYDNS